MAIQAKLFDGTILQFPDGTDPSVIDKVAAQETSSRQKVAAPAEETPKAKEEAGTLAPSLHPSEGFLKNIGFETNPNAPRETISAAPPASIAERDQALSEALKLKQMREDYAYKPEGGVLEQLGTGVKRTAMKGAYALEQGAGGNIQFLGDMFGADTTKPQAVLDDINKKVEAIGDPESHPARLVEGAVTSIAQQLPGLGLSVATGTEIPALTSMFMNSFGQTYDDSRRKGLDIKDSTERSAIFASAEVAGEKFGLGNLMKGLSGAFSNVATKDLSKEIAKYIIKQVPGEELTYATQFAADKTFGLNPEAGLAQFLDGAADTFYATMIQGGFMMGGAHAINQAASVIRKENPELSAEEAKNIALDKWQKQGQLAKPLTPPVTPVTETPTSQQTEQAKEDAAKEAKAKAIENPIYQERLNKLIAAGGQDAGVTIESGGKGVDLSGQPDVKKSGPGAGESVGSSMAGTGDNVGAIKAGTIQQPATLTSAEGTPFATNGQAQKFRKENELNDLFTVTKLPEGGFVLTPKAVTPTQIKPVETVKEKPAEKIVEQKETTLKDVGGGAAQAIKENLYGGLFEALQQGETKFAGIKDPVLARAKPYFDNGMISSAEDLQNFENQGYPELTPLQEVEDQKVEAEKLADQLMPSEEAAVSTAPQAQDVVTEAQPEELRRLEENYKVKTTEAAKKDQVTEETIDSYNELSKKDTDQKELPGWGKLNTAEKAIYTATYKSQDAPAAIKALRDFRYDQEGNVNPPKEEDAALYELNRESAAKEHKIDMPKWHDLSPESQEAFLSGLPKLTRKKTAYTGADLHSAFGTVATQLEQEEKGIRGASPVDIERAKLTGTEQEAKARAQAEIEQGRAAEAEAVGKGEALPDTAQQALQKDGINGVLDYIATQAKGLKDTYDGKSGAFKLLQSLHKKATSVVFQRLARTLSKVDFQSKIVTDPNDAAIQRLQQEGKLAEYDPKTDTFYFTPEGMDESTILHEVIHAATVKLINQFQTNPESLTGIQKEAVEHLNKLFTFVKGRLGGKYANATENIYEFVSYAMTDSRFQEALANLQVPRLAKYTAPDPELKGLVKTAWGQFTQALSKMYNLVKAGPTAYKVYDEIYGPLAKEFASTKGSLDELYKDITDDELAFEEAQFEDEQAKAPEKFTAANKLISIGKGYEGNILLEVSEVMNQILAAPEAGTEVAPLAAKVTSALKPKQAKQAEKGPRTWEDMKSSAALRSKKAVSRAKRIALGFLHPKESYEYLVPRIQNSAVGLKLWENRLKPTGKIESDPNKKFTNAYELLSLAAAKAKYMYDEYILPHEEIMNSVLRDLMKSTGKSLADVLEDTGLYMTGLHEPERRRLMFVTKVPLRNDINITINGVTDTPANFRDYIMNALESLKDTPQATASQQAEYLRKVLDAIVFTNPGNLTSPNKDVRKGTLNTANIDFARQAEHPKEFDENSTNYSVVGQFSPDEIDIILDKFNKDPNKAKIEELNKAIHAMELATIELNKQGNYWSPPVSNRVAFYGFKHYVPFKGRPELAEKQNDGLFTSTDDLRSKDFQFYQGAMQGRTSEADNPVIQVVVDAEKAAFIASHNKVTQAVANAIEEKLIPGKLEKKIAFNERFEGLTKEEIAKKNTIFNYKPDGTIEIYSVKDQPILDALRQPYVEHHEATQALLDVSGFINRFMGQGYTRFNPGFPPWNMGRDIVTNLLNVTIEQGPLVSSKMLGKTIYNTVFDTVMLGGMASAARDMDLYKQGKIGALENKAKRDAYTADFLKMAKRGGVVSYLQGVTNTSKLKEMSKDIENKNWEDTKRYLTILFDYWFDAFENVVRTSGNSVLVKYFKEQGLSQEAAEIRAAAYNKNLANFEQSGKYGSEMGSLYMFSRPQATGAVRAIDALKYGFVPMKEELAKLPEIVQNDPAAVAAFKKDYEAKAFRARTLVATLVGLGVAIYMMSFMSSDKDEQGNNIVAKDDKARWTRAARFTIPGTDYIFQVPNGFGLGAFIAWGEQMGAFAMGHQSFSEFLSNCSTIGLDSFIPLPVSRMPFFESPSMTAKAVLDTIWPSPGRPAFEWVINTNGLGQEIVHDTRGTSEAYSGNMSVPEKYREFSDWLNEEFGISVSPNLTYFFVSNYANAFTLVGQNLDNMAGLMSGDRDFNAKTDTIVLNSFISNRSDYYSKEFNRVEKEVLNMKGNLDAAKKHNRLNKYLAEHPYELTVIDHYDRDVGSRLKELRAERTRIINMGMTQGERDKALKDNKIRQQAAKAEMVAAYKYYLPKLKTRQDED